MDVLLFIPVAVTLVGVYLLVRLHFLPLRPIKLFGDTRKLLKKKGAFGSLSLALAGTLGVGNIVGVSVGLISGGAGSVFWLVISAIPAAAIKYCESVLAVGSKSELPGMMGVMSPSPRTGHALASLYALLVLLLSFFMGAAFQSASFAETFGEVFEVSPSLFGPLMLVPTLPILFFDVKKVKDVTAVLVSAASVCYVFMAIYIIFLFRENIPDAVRSIFTSAFTARAGFGGAVGATVMHTVREGFCRGILSNESGLGTSSLAHGSEALYSPHGAGVVGVLEVIFDTVILCPLTALMLLVGAVGDYSSSVEFLLSAIRPAGAAFEYLFVVSVFLFAYSTVVCWSAYGKTCFSFLFPKGVFLFRVIFALFVLFGASMGSRLSVTVIDYLMLPIAALSLFTVIKSSDRAVALSKLGDI